jgi:unsaturated chondroitin disaccharide hydrolase
MSQEFLIPKRETVFGCMPDGLFIEALDLISTKTTEDDSRLGTFFPYVTDPDGRWLTMRASVSAGYTPAGWTHGNWFCGFWVGLLLVAYLHTKKQEFLDLAIERMRLVVPRATDPNTHDIGFIFWSSAVPAYRITGEKWIADVGLLAADHLRRRLVGTERGAYIAAWGPVDDPRARSSSAIDTMANLPLLYWAGERANDASFLTAGEAHAAMTRGAFIRDDYSTFHAVEYELPRGTRKRGFTFQGWNDNSTWSRGQAWAIYGYVATARATGRRDYLTIAERLANRYRQRLDNHLVPWWDFDDPAIPNAPRDSSAAAIVASALLDLAALHPDQTAGRIWLERAYAMLECLCSDYLARDATHRGILKHGCYSKPHKEGMDSAVLFGDFYFAEALSKSILPGQLTDVPVRMMPA